MRKVLTFFTLLLIHISGIFAQQVAPGQAAAYAKDFMQYAAPQKYTTSADVAVFQQSKDQSAVYTYIINFEPEGWVLMSGDEKAEPVLAWSPTGYFETDGIDQLPFYFWFQEYENQIAELVESATAQRNTNWDRLPAFDKSSAIAPIIKVKWNQNSGWNAHCPEDASGPGGRAYAGCVAVAMAQNMSVYQHPSIGHGSKSYNSDYGPLTANFGETEYRWDLTHATSPNEHIALILYHLAVSVEMQFAGSGSGAFSRDVPGAIKTYFDYSNDARMISRSNYQEGQWAEIMANELREGRPVYYAGNGNDGQAGHAFNLDGMDGSGRFHFNWGWGGSLDGYFYLNPLNPGSYNFSHNQQAVINFKPRNHWPTDIKLSEVKVEEGLPEGTVVGSFSAVDETPNDSHTYFVEGPESIFGFRIDVPFTAEDNKLVTTRELDYSDASSYEIFVTVTDEAGHYYTRNFFIEIIQIAADENQGGDVVTSVAPLNQAEELSVWTRQNELNFRMSGDFMGGFTLRLFDITGRQLVAREFQKNSYNFNNSFALDASLPSGIYFVAVDLPGKGRLSKRVVLQ